MYNTPTLVGYHLEPSGAEYTARLEDRDMRFVPPELRKFMSQKSFPPGMKAPDGSDLDEAYHKWTGPVERMTMALYNAGSPLLSGTDYPYNVSMPGKGLLKELELFVQIGMTPYGALKTSTVTAQEFIRQTVESEKDMHRGVVVEGYDADLLLVEGNPLENISNVRNNVGVMVDGAWYPASEMRNRLEKLSRTWK
jgi:imidazolonepropionase-like amidohydrolase